MEDVRRTKNIYYILIGVVIFIVAVVSLSYAFFVSQVSNNESTSTITGEAANLNIIFKEGSEIIEDKAIFPGWEATKTFSVENPGNSLGEYVIYIYDVVNELMDGSIVFEITSNSSGAKEFAEQSLPSFNTILYPDNDASQNPNIKIEGKAVHTYTLTVRYVNFENINQYPDAGKTFSFKVGIKKSAKSHSVTNLIANGSFENGITGWTASGGTFTTSNTYKKFGTYSLRNYHQAQWSLARETIAGYANHVYYTNFWMYSANTGKKGCYTEYSPTWLESGTRKYAIQPALRQTTANVWEFKSGYYDLNLSHDYNIWYSVCVYDGTDGAQDCYCDGVMLIDLSADFGDDLPNQNWCDKYLTYFDSGSKDFYY